VAPEYPAASSFGVLLELSDIFAHPLRWTMTVITTTTGMLTGRLVGVSSMSDEWLRAFARDSCKHQDGL
jgi:hypothetical protein